LTWKPKRDAGVECVEWRTFDQLRIGEPCLMAGFQFVRKKFALCSFVEEKKPVHALEIAIDTFQLGDGFDPLDRGRMRIGGTPSPFITEECGEIGIAIVERIGDVRSGSARLATAHRAIVDYDHRLAGTREKVRGGQTGNAGSDDANVRAFITPERREREDLGRVHPERFGRAGTGVHACQWFEVLVEYLSPEHSVCHV